MTTQLTIPTRVDRPNRGIAHFLHPQVFGGIIGGIGASAFVHINKGALPEPGPTIATALWAVALLVCAWAVLIRPRHLRNLTPPRPHAGAIFSFSVLGMLAVFFFSAMALKSLGRPELQPAVVVMAVGLHFVPFAAVFGAKVFRVLGWSMFWVGLGAFVLGLIFGAVYVAAGAVATGVLMLVIMSIDATATEGTR